MDGRDILLPLPETVGATRLCEIKAELAVRQNDLYETVRGVDAEDLAAFHDSFMEFARAALPRAVDRKGLGAFLLTLNRLISWEHYRRALRGAIKTTDLEELHKL